MAWQSTKSDKPAPLNFLSTTTTITTMSTHTSKKRAWDDMGEVGEYESGGGGGGSGEVKGFALLVERRRHLAELKAEGRAMIAELRRLGVTPACRPDVVARMMEGAEQSGTNSGQVPPAKELASGLAYGAGGGEPS